MQNDGMRSRREVALDEMVMRDRIQAVLEDGPKTIPEIAEILHQPSHEVMFWAMAMWRYGKIVEVGKANEDGYYEYQLKK